MSRKAWPVALAAIGLAANVYAQDPTPATPDDPTPFKLPDHQDPNPLKLAEAPADQSVYALPTGTSPDQGINLGGVNIDMTITYLTDYLYRGVNVGEQLNPGTGVSNANFQFNGTLIWNLGPKLPHPFIGIFTNVLSSDSISNFQEVRPFFGAEWRIRPFIIAGGNNSYTYPDRSNKDTNEVFLKITLDDSVLLHSDQPVFSPYVYAAYDYDLYDGWYVEAGIKHDFVFEKLGLVVTPVLNIAYVANNAFFAGFTGKDTGFQHYDVGATFKYSLNLLLNIPQRYGQWSVNGYLFYSDSISDKLNADTTIWGGVGIGFAY
ncbi:MAG: hypothetical protein NTU53_03050 [Planctomycetota bacterium]|nr:hypothetical protein [Planctomycetota bacterium]